MNVWLHDIGCAAGLVPGYAIRLTIEGNDSAGAGSAALDEGLEDDQKHIVDDEGFRDEDLDDDQPRGKRDKQTQAYDKLKSERDRLQRDLEARDRELQGLTQRVESIEQTRESRKDTNERTNANIEQAKARAREVAAELKKLDRNDPNYTEKVYETFFEKLYTDLPKAAEDISRRTSTEVYRETRSQEERTEEAERAAVVCLEDMGLGEEQLPLVKYLASQKPDSWFRRTAANEQVPELVKEAVTMIRGIKRNTQEFKDDKDRHRKPMDGVIDQGRGRVAGQRREEDEDRQTGPGSILADLARLRKTQRQNTSVMLRQSER